MLPFFSEGMPGCLRLCARSLFNGKIVVDEVFGMRGMR